VSNVRLSALELLPARLARGVKEGVLKGLALWADGRVHRRVRHRVRTGLRGIGLAAVHLERVCFVRGEEVGGEGLVVPRGGAHDEGGRGGGDGRKKAETNFRKLAVALDGRKQCKVGVGDCMRRMTVTVRICMLQPPQVPMV
jgi:hypothetical protein